MLLLGSGRLSEQVYSLLLGVVTARWYLWLVVLNQGTEATDYNTTAKEH
jgi:hypothetical protein